MVRAELRETRSLEETNWYFAIEVWACAWTIENMPKASAKLKFNKLVRNFRVKTKKKKEKSENQKNLPGGESSKVSCVTGGDNHHYTTEELSA